MKDYNWNLFNQLYDKVLDCRSEQAIQHTLDSYKLDMKRLKTYSPMHYDTINAIANTIGNRYRKGEYNHEN